jgi:hypothetical protein
VDLVGLKSQIEAADQMTGILHLVAGKAAADPDLQIQTFHPPATAAEVKVMEAETNWGQELEELRQQALPVALLTKIAAIEDLPRT